MAGVREVVGRALCLNPDCGEEIPVKRGAGGALSLCCPFCDMSVYAKAGTMAHRQVSARLAPPDDSKPAAPAAPMVPPPKPAPLRPAASTIFG